MAERGGRRHVMSAWAHTNPRGQSFVYAHYGPRGRGGVTATVGLLEHPGALHFLERFRSGELLLEHDVALAQEETGFAGMFREVASLPKAPGSAKQDWSPRNPDRLHKLMSEYDAKKGGDLVRWVRERLRDNTRITRGDVIRLAKQAAHAYRAEEDPATRRPDLDEDDWRIYIERLMRIL